MRLHGWLRHSYRQAETAGAMLDVEVCVLPNVHKPSSTPRPGGQLSTFSVRELFLQRDRGLSSGRVQPLRAHENRSQAAS